MDTIELLITSLATWRIASLIAAETGPFDIFKKMRMFFASRGSLGKQPFQTISDGINCTWCVSLWASPFAALFVSDNLTEWIVFVFAISTGAIIIDSLIRKLDG